MAQEDVISQQYGPHDPHGLERPGEHTVSTIICAYTEARFQELLDAIASVQAQTLPAYEIIVVIDHNPKLLERLRSQVSADIILVESQYMSGLSGGRNTGIMAAHGEFVAFLDDDAVADPQWLENLLEAFESPQVMGVGGFIEPLWKTARPAWFPEEFLWVVGCSYRGMPTHRALVRNVIGCNMAFRRSVCLAVGGFDLGLGHSGGRSYGDEETHFCIHVRQALPESELLYTPVARVHHHVTAIREQWAYFRERCWLEGRSKATLAGMVGKQDALASERAYVSRALPLGVARGCRDMLFHRDVWGGLRALAIVAGFLTTTTAYATTRARLYLSQRTRAKAVAIRPATSG